MIEIKGYEELYKQLWENKDSDQVMMLYFGTSWCGPCQQLKEKINTEKEHLKDLTMLYIDCDEQDNEDIVNDWNITSLPTQIFVTLKGENVVKNSKIEGYDWTKFQMEYNKIIENKSD